jgi:protein SCO1
MSKKALLALLVALLVPIICYLWVKTAATGAVDIPRKYLLDTVVEKVVNGKQVSDSVWHKTKNIKLVNQLGDTVSLYDKPGKIIVADFIFTHCRSICPVLTRNMATLQKSFKTGGNVRNKIDTNIVQFVSFSIDTDRDSAAALKKYADRFGVNHDNWWLLTGNQDSIAKFAFEELRVDQFSGEPVDSDFVHTNRFVLLDKDYVVRGYYNGLDSIAVSKLARDIGILMLEKDRKKPSTVFTKIIDLSWLWFLVAVIVVGFVFYFTKGRKNDGA